jgi:sulfite reductase alpha subunit-like flavoprotein
MLHNRMLQLGARLFCARGEGNEQHPEGHNGDFRAWIVALKQGLLENFPLPEGHDIIPEHVFLEPKWCLRLCERVSLSGPGTCFENPTLETPPEDDILPINDSVTADIISNTRLTPKNHHQDVRLLDFRIPTYIDYKPGAVAVVYPKNFPKDVNQFVECMGWESMVDTPLQLVPTAEVFDLATYPPSPLRHVSPEKKSFTMRELLTNYLDILSIPRRTFFASLAHFTKDTNQDEAFQKERILELANPELIDELWDYTTRPRRTILEIMPEFPSVKIPWKYALTILPLMRGRQFSIASGGHLKRFQDGSGRVQLLVAIADPPNPIIKLRKRYGVCTRYIATLQAGRQLALSIQPGYLNVTKEEMSTPVLMIGPGTGVAPMRSMIYERLAWAKEQGANEAQQKDMLLFFGCRNKNSDYFFQSEWEELSSSSSCSSSSNNKNHLTVFAAFSRDTTTTPKTYVQDLLCKEAKLVYQLVHHQGGKVYVCGSSGNMPKGVREALSEVLKQQGGLSDDEAILYLERLEREGRYKQETW